MWWRSASGESCTGEVHCAPEEVDRRYLSDESRTERRDDAVGLNELAPEQVDGFGVVGAVDVIVGKRKRRLDLIRCWLNCH